MNQLFGIRLIGFIRSMGNNVKKIIDDLTVKFSQTRKVKIAVDEGEIRCLNQSVGIGNGQMDSDRARQRERFAQ